MESGLFLQTPLVLLRQPLSRKNNDRRDVRLKNLQTMVDLAFVGNNHAQWAAALTELHSAFLHIPRQPEPDVVEFYTCGSDQSRIGRSALPKQMQLVFARCEIYRRQILRGNLAIDSHSEGGDDEWAQRPLFL